MGDKQRLASSICDHHRLMIEDKEQIASALPGYELGARLGRGAFGLVLAGRHQGLGRDVAIKVLPVDHEETTERSWSEARLLASLDHPHIVRVYDAVAVEDLHLIVMELLAGGPLTRRRQDLTAEMSCAVGLAVAAALSYAHGRKVLHRDIKPANVLFDAEGLPKVADFGIAKVAEGSATTASAVIGTPRYMAPEQILGGRLSAATDLYALGVMLYELLTGRPPFDASLPAPALIHHHLNVLPPPPAGVPAPVAAVVMRTLAKNPDDRHTSAHAFALDLATAAARAYGPGWISRAGIELRLDADIRAAADESTVVTPASRTSATPIAPSDTGPPSAREDSGAEPLASTLPASVAVPSTSPPASDSILQSTQRAAFSPQDTTQLVPPPVPPEAPGPRTRRKRHLAIVSAAALLAITGTTLGLTIIPRGSDATESHDAAPTATLSAGPLGYSLAGHSESVRSVAYSPNGRILASAGGSDMTVRLWDVSDPAHARSLSSPLTGFPVSAASVAFSPDGRTLATGGIDGSSEAEGRGVLLLWDVSDPASPRRLGSNLKGHVETVSSLAFSPDGRILASSDSLTRTYGKVRLWDVSDPENSRPLGDPFTDFEWPGSVAFSPNGRILATSGSGNGTDGVLRIWDVSNPARPSPLGSPVADIDVGPLAFSRDGRTLATGVRSCDYSTGTVDHAAGMVQLWDVSVPANLRRLGPPLSADPLGSGSSVVFSRDGRTLVAGGGSCSNIDREIVGVLRRWDVSNPAQPRPLGSTITGPTDGPLRSVAISPDGRTVASGGADHIVRLLKVR